MIHVTWSTLGSSPADNLLIVLRSKTGLFVPDSEIDWGSFVLWRTHCKAHRLRHQFEKTYPTLLAVVQEVLNAGQAEMLYHDKRYRILIPVRLP